MFQPPGTFHDGTVLEYHADLQLRPSFDSPEAFSLISRIQRAARASCRRLLPQIINKVVRNLNDKLAL